MRRMIAALVATVVLLGVGVVVAPPSPAGAACAGGDVRVRGLVTDRATGRPLSEVTSVGIQEIPSGYDDGVGTNTNSRWSTCIPPGEYQFTFFADSYRMDQHAGAQATVALPGPVVINAALTPWGKVIAGRVTNRNGRPLFASVGIWHLTPRGWRSIDGEGTDDNGRWSYRVPRAGRYRVSFAVDHYWARWHDDDNRRRHAKVIVVPEGQSLTTGVNAQLRFCTNRDVQCFPRGFNT